MDTETVLQILEQVLDALGVEEPLGSEILEAMQQEIQPAPLSRTLRELPASQVEAILQLSNSGVRNKSEIARRVGVTPQTVLKVLRAHRQSGFGIPGY